MTDARSSGDTLLIVAPEGRDATVLASLLRESGLVVQIDETGELLLEALQKGRSAGAIITDEALTAAVDLTDRYVTDRRRPDKAIDALDEACAHTQAVARYPQRAEELIRDRMIRLREAHALIETLARREPS